MSNAKIQQQHTLKISELQISQASPNKPWSVLKTIFSRNSPALDIDKPALVEKENNGILKTSKMSKAEISRADRKVHFNEFVEIEEAISHTIYDRRGTYIAKSLTSDIVRFIKNELNETKREMPIHEDSKKHTQFYK